MKCVQTSGKKDNTGIIWSLFALWVFVGLMGLLYALQHYRPVQEQALSEQNNEASTTAPSRDEHTDKPTESIALLPAPIPAPSPVSQKPAQENRPMLKNENDAKKNTASNENTSQQPLINQSMVNSPHSHQSIGNVTINQGAPAAHVHPQAI